MSESTKLSKPNIDFETVLSQATRLPGVSIDREKFLRGAFTEHVDAATLEKIIDTSPAAAGVSRTLVANLAIASINHETNQVSLISAAAGMPGGFAMLVAIPADVAQYLAHMLRISQKLAYLQSWPTLFGDDKSDVDDSTKNVMILFLGVMAGVQTANAGLMKVSTSVADKLVRTLPQKALTQGAVFPLVKRVAALMGKKLTERTFAAGVGKVVPVIGALVSGTITYFSFKPMAKRLNTHLAKSPLAKPKVAPKARKAIAPKASKN